MRISHILAAATLTLTASVASAATIWAPTNDDTDFIQLDFGGNPDAGPGIKTNGGTLALFDDDFANDLNSGAALVIGQTGGHVVFTENADGTAWNAEVFDVSNVSGGSITLTDSFNFVLGVNWGLGYYGDTNSTKISSPDTRLIVFDGMDGDEEKISGNTLAVDLDLAPIPVPAAVWLFGTGLLGLVAVARRRG